MLSWGTTLRILTRFRVDAILPFSDRTHLLFPRSARAHRSRLRLPRSVSLEKASGTRAAAQSWYSFPRHSDRWHQGKATKSRQRGHDTQNWLGWEADDHDQRVPRAPGP